MSEWKEYRIGDTCSRLSSGKSIKSSLIKDCGLYPVYGGNGIRGYTDTYNFDGECAIIGRQGASCGNVRYFSGKAYMTEHAVVAVPTDEHNTYYLSCVLASLKLGRLSGQSAQPGIGVGLIGKQTITMPSLATQNRIASILSSLDDKIAVNRRICENLEAQAQALFKYWFIDFAPFKDGKFVESELGMIPEGWRVGTLGDIADVIMGQSPAGTSYNESGNGVIFYQGRTEFGFRFPGIRLFTTEPKRYAEPHSTLMSVRAPVGDINVASEKCCIGRGLASIRSKTDLHSYIFYLMKSLKRRLDIYNGEGTVFGSVNKDTLNGLKFIIAPTDIQEKYNDIVKMYDGMIFELHKEINNLVVQRDTLLPKLMSGEIKL